MQSRCQGCGTFGYGTGVCPSCNNRMVMESIAVDAAGMRSNFVAIGQSLHTGPVSNRTVLANIPSYSVWGRNMEEECICIFKFLVCSGTLAYYAVIITVCPIIAVFGCAGHPGYQALVFIIMIILLVLPSSLLMLRRKYLMEQQIVCQDDLPCFCICASSPEPTTTPKFKPSPPPTIQGTTVVSPIASISISDVEVTTIDKSKEINSV